MSRSEEELIKDLVNLRHVLAEERARTDRLVAALMEVLSPHIASDGIANHTLDEWLQIVVNRLVDDRAQALDAVKQAEAEVGRLRDLGWERRALAAEELLKSKSADLDKVLAANERLSQNRDQWAKWSGEWEARAKSLEEELAECEERHAVAERKLVDAEAVARAVTLAEHKQIEERADGRDAMLVSSLRVKLAQMESALKEEKLMHRRAVGFYGILLGRLDTSATEEEVSRDIQRLTTICSEQSEKIRCLERELQELRSKYIPSASPSAPTSIMAGGSKVQWKIESESGTVWRVVVGGPGADDVVVRARELLEERGALVGMDSWVGEDGRLVGRFLKAKVALEVISSCFTAATRSKELSDAE